VLQSEWRTDSPELVTCFVIHYQQKTSWKKERFLKHKSSILIVTASSTAASSCPQGIGKLERHANFNFWKAGSKIWNQAGTLEDTQPLNPWRIFRRNNLLEFHNLWVTSRHPLFSKNLRHVVQFKILYIKIRNPSQCTNYALKCKNILVPVSVVCPTLLFDTLVRTDN
jgi:hypothetical protein